MPESMEEMGYTKAWFGSVYRNIAEQAREHGNFSAANGALDNLARMVAEEEQAEPEQAATPERIDIDALGAVLDKVAGVVGTADAVQIPSLATQKAYRAAEKE